MFGARFAKRMAARYRKRGLSPTARAIVDLVTQGGVQGATVLEVGGGRRRDPARAAAPRCGVRDEPRALAGYEPEAAALIEDAGLGGRVHRRLVDIATDPAAVEPADVVVLHRVVCCYPDVGKLLGAAGDHARKQLVFSHPPRNAVSRAVVATQNLMLRAGGRDFRTFAHSPDAMLAVLAEHGLRLRAAHRGRVWQVAAVSR